MFGPGRSVVVPVQRSKNLRAKPTGTFCCDEKEIATSTLHEVLRSQLVAVSGGDPEMLHGVAVEQNCTLVTGSAEAGP